MKNVAFTRWDPLRDLFVLHEQLGHLVGSDAPGWTPLVDLYETADAFMLTAELPGIPREQIEIQAEEHRIVIRGERTAGPGGHGGGTHGGMGGGMNVPCEQYHRVERGHGRFSRAFALPDLIDVDRVTADLREGLLTVTLPKAQDRGTRRVSVT
jgi:HSP20 family protein